MNRQILQGIVVGNLLVCAVCILGVSSEAQEASHDEYVANLLEMLKGTNEERSKAWGILRELGPEYADSAPLLIEAGREESTRRGAAMALGTMGAVIKDELLDALHNEHPGIQCIAADTFSRIDKNVIRDCFDELREALKSSQADAANSLNNAIGRLGEAAVPAAADVLLSAKLGGQVPDYASIALAGMGPKAIPYILVGIKHENASVRLAAVESLRTLAPESPEQCVNALVEAFGDKDPKVVVAAVRALDRVGPPAHQATEQLKAMLSDALDMSEIDSPLQLWEVLPAALVSIAPDDEEIVPLLIPMIQSGDRRRVTIAARATAEMGASAKAAMSVLFEALENSRSNDGVARALVAIDPKSDLVFSRLLEKHDLSGTGLQRDLEIALSQTEPDPEFAVAKLAEKLIQAHVSKAEETPSLEEPIAIIQQTLCDNSVSAKNKRFVLTWLGKIGTEESINSISAFEDWAEARRAEPWEVPDTNYLGSAHFAPSSGRKEPWLTCKDSDGNAWELYNDDRFGSGPDALYRLQRKGAEKSVWVGGLDIDMETYWELNREGEPAIQIPTAGVLRLTLGSRDFDFDLKAAAVDSDGDGLTDVVENYFTTDPKAKDSDADGINDLDDGNPLTPRQEETTEEQAIHQAMFTYLWSTSNAPNTVLVRDMEQEFYGYPGVVLPAGESRKGFATISFGDIKYLSDTEVRTTISDYMGPEAASGNDVRLRKIHGKWVVVYFTMTWIS